MLQKGRGWGVTKKGMFRHCLYGAEWHVVKLIVQQGLASFAEPCVMECHESKGACEQCKKGAGLAPLDLSRFTATALRYTGGQLVRQTTKQDYAVRQRTCPACAKTLAGCRPPRHWAFARSRHHHHPGGRRLLHQRRVGEEVEEVEVGVGEEDAVLDA